jgi:hypothetical protein
LAAFTAVEKRERRERRESVSENNQHPALVALLQMMKQHCMCKTKITFKKNRQGIDSLWGKLWQDCGFKLGLELGSFRITTRGPPNLQAP